MRIFSALRKKGRTLLGSGKARPRPAVRLQLERLEEKVVPACTITWSNPAGGAWETASNWTPSRVPLPTDEVCIAPGAGVNVALNTASTVLALELGSGRLEGSGELTISGTFDWTGGTLSGSGRTVVVGGITVRGNANKVLQDGRQLENAATAVWTGAGEIVMGSGAVLRNLPGATWDAQNDSFIARGSGPLPTFENAGRFVKSAGDAESGIEVRLTLAASGVVEVSVGTLFLSSEVTAQGSFTVAKGAELNFDGGNHALNAGSNVGGAGRVVFSGGSSTILGNFAVTGATNITGGDVAFNRDASTGGGLLSRGFLGGSGTFSINANFDWTGGEMRGIGVTRTEASGTLAISGDATKTLRRRAVTCLANCSWSGAGSIEASEGARFENNGLFAVSSNASFRGEGPAPILFENTGVVRRTGAGVTRFEPGVTFNSPKGASVDVQEGGLELANGTGGGVFTAAEGASLTFTGGVYLLGKTSRVHGEGAIGFAATTVTVEGNYDSPAETRISSGQVIFNGPNPRMRSGLMIGGTLTGSSDVTVEPNLLFSWNGGTITGSTLLVISKGASFGIGGSFAKLLDGRSIQNAGAVQWTGGLPVANGANWDNLPGSLVESGNATMSHTAGDPSRFTTEGLYRKLGGATTTFGTNITFTNSGVVEVLAGLLSLAGDFTNFANQTLTGGTFYLVGTLQFVGADVRTNEATVILSGPASALVNQGGGNGLANFHTNVGYFGLEGGRDLTVAAFTNSGELAIQNPSSFTATGLFSWTGGTLSGTGTLRANGGLELNSDFLFLWELTVELRGISTWTAGDLYADFGARIIVLGTLNIPADVNAFHFGLGDPVRVVNNGTVARTTSPGAAVLWEGVGFTNNGELLVEAGTLALTGGLTNYDLKTGSLAGGRYSVTGTLLVPQLAVVNNRASVGLFGPKAQVVDENYFDALGTLSSVAAGSSVGLGGGAFLVTFAETFTNEGQITLAGASGFFSYAATFTNSGRIDLFDPDTALAVAGTLVTGGVNSALTLRAGTALAAAEVRLTSGVFTSTAATVSAAVTVENGSFSASGTITGAVTLLGGTTNTAAPTTINGAVTVMNGTFSALGTINGNVTVQGGTTTSTATINGNVTLEGGTFTSSTTINGSVTVTNGTFNASGTITRNVLLQGGRVNLAGNTTGMLTVNGNWTQTGGILQVQLRTALDFDRLNIGGTATLGGTLEVRLLAGFDPPLEMPFDFLAAMAVQGAFTDISPPPGMVFRVDPSATGRALVREE